MRNIGIRILNKKIKSTDTKETKKDRDNFRKGWDRIWGDKKKGGKNAKS